MALFLESPLVTVSEIPDSNPPKKHRSFYLHFFCNFRIKMNIFSSFRFFGPYGLCEWFTHSKALFFLISVWRRNVSIFCGNAKLQKRQVLFWGCDHCCQKWISKLDVVTWKPWPLRHELLFWISSTTFSKIGVAFWKLVNTWCCWFFPPLNLPPAPLLLNRFLS